MLWFILGLIIGGAIGIIAISLCVAAARADDWAQKYHGCNKENGTVNKAASE